VRNIPGIRRSQDLFDDLSDDPADWSVAMAAESAGRIETASAVATRPFDYGTVITYTFETAHWQATRFSDGTRYGVWYGSWDTTTTVYETACHWSRFVRDSFAGERRWRRTRDSSTAGATRSARKLAATSTTSDRTAFSCARRAAPA
jgi:hypothetical protein